MGAGPVGTKKTTQVVKRAPAAAPAKKPAPAAPPPEKGWGPKAASARAPPGASVFAQSAGAAPKPPVDPGPFVGRFTAELSKIPAEKRGSNVVAQDIASQMTALQGAPLSREKRLEKAELLLVSGLRAGRGPAMKAIESFLKFTRAEGIPLTADTKQALQQAVATLKDASMAGLVAEQEKLSGLAGTEDAATLRDLSILSRAFSQGNDLSRTKAALLVLSTTSGGVAPLGELVRNVAFGGGSKVLPFSASEQVALRKLASEFGHATPAQQEALMTQHQGVLRKLEQACGSLSANAPPQYLEEQRSRPGGGMLAVTSRGDGGAFFDDVGILKELGTLEQAVQ